MNPLTAMLGASRSLLDSDWSWPLHGLRHLPAKKTPGWFLWTGELIDDSDFVVPIHARHLVERTPQLGRFLALPPGSRFVLAPGHEDVWDDPALLVE